MTRNFTSGAVEISFGPSANTRFDFTLLFENAILSILPSSLFFILLPQRLLWLIKQPRKVKKNSRYLLKLGLITVYTVLQLATLLYWTVGPLHASKYQIAASVLVFINGVSLLFLSYAEHVRSVKPSTLINVYLLLTLLFDCAIARTLWLLDGTTVAARLFTTTAAIKCLILVVEAWEKKDILDHQYKNLSPEATSGIYNRSVFWWLNPLMRVGFVRLLTDRDLYGSPRVCRFGLLTVFRYPIDSGMASKRLLAEIEKSWGSANQGKKNSLFWSTLWASRAIFLSGVFARLCLIGFKYAQPFLINRTVVFSTDLEQSDDIGWGLTGAWLLLFIGLAISNGAFYHMTYRFVTSVRGSLISMIYCKTLDLNLTALDESVAVTLMSTDSENICLSFANLHEVWAAPIECVVALILLYRQLKLAFLAPMIVAIIATLCIMQLAKYMGHAQKLWVRGIQTRVDVTASMLGSMKEVKMLGLGDLLTKTVQNLRVKELSLSKKARKLLCLRVFLGSSIQTIAPLATFATFVILSNTTHEPLDTAAAYTSLSLIYLLADPMATMIRTIPNVSTALACFDRIQSFLLSESAREHRLPLKKSNLSEETTADRRLALGENDISIELENGQGQMNQNSGASLMVIKDASFGWTDAAPDIISNISCTIRKGHFTFIVGSVGSGKSTLMQAMLGEIQPSQGFIHTGTREIAYVGQAPWVRNLTIQENILGISGYNETWYNKVVHACALEHDIMELPDKHATKVGSGGVSLSGGQKQRLALARAVYSQKEVVFLDDVFAGQDTATEEHIHQMLFSRRGLFRELGTTVVCITNAVHRLVYADNVIALSVKGHILHQGSFQDLQSVTDYFDGLSTKQNNPLDTLKESDVSIIDRPIASKPRVTDQEQESLERKSGELATYKYYFGSVPLWHSLLLLVFVFLYGGSSKMTELLLAFWTGHATISDDGTNNFYVGLYGLLSGLAVLGLLGSIWHFMITMVPLSSEILHARLLKTTMEAPLSFFTKTDVGVTTNRFSQDMSIVDTDIPFTLIDLCLNLSEALMSAVLMCVFSGYFVVTLPLVMFFCWLLQKFYLRTSRQIRLLDLEAKSPLFTQFLETLLGLSTVRAFGWESHFKESHLELLDASQRPYYLLFCIQRWLALILDLMVAAMATILMVLVVKLRASFSPEFVALALLNVTSFNQSLAMIIKGWTQMETSFGAISRLKQFCSETENENLPTEVSPIPENWPSYGHISLENVTASYSSGAEPVLHNVTLDIPSGSKIGICGRSGSGKSSLVACLLRLLEITEDSSINIDGINIATLPRQAVRAVVTVVPQNPFFLKTSRIRENLIPQGQQNDERILTVLRQLKIAGLVESMGGLDATLDVDRLSQGQRQFFCLARAILSNKKIILLDEASSNVDEKSEELIRQVIRDQFLDCTIIAVAHRVGALVDFDRVAVMSGGRVVEWDNPKKLLQRDSEFKRLWDFSSG